MFINKKAYLGERIFLGRKCDVTYSSPLWFRKAEISPDPAEEAHAGPEEAGFALPVPRGGVQHVGHDDAVHDAHDVVDVSRQHDGFGLESCGGDLGDEGVADGADGDVVGECVNEEYGANAPGCAFGVGDADQADEEQEEGEQGQAVAVQCSSTHAHHEEPGADCADETDGVLGSVNRGAWIDGKRRVAYLRHTHVKRIHSRQAGLLIEVCRVTHESTAAQILN